jgi:hypothetical protein
MRFLKVFKLTEIMKKYLKQLKVIKKKLIFIKILQKKKNRFWEMKIFIEFPIIKSYTCQIGIQPKIFLMKKLRIKIE